MCRNWFLDEIWFFRMFIFISTVYCLVIKIFLIFWFVVLLEEVNFKLFIIFSFIMVNIVKNIYFVNIGKDRYSEGKNFFWIECKIVAKVVFILIFYRR